MFYTLSTLVFTFQHGKEEINSSIIQQKLNAIEKCNKSALSAEEAQSMEDERSVSKLFSLQKICCCTCEEILIVVAKTLLAVEAVNLVVFHLTNCDLFVLVFSAGLR